MTDDFTLDSPESSPEVLSALVVTDLSLDRFLSYSIPPGMPLKLGSRVAVYVRNDLRKGYVMGILPRAELAYSGKLRPIHALCEDEPAIPESLISLGQWMAQYYCCAQEPAICTLLPGAVRSGKNKPRKVPFILPAASESIQSFLTRYEKKRKAQCALLEKIAQYPEGILKSDLTDESPTVAASLKKLIESGVVSIETRFVGAVETEGPQMLRSEALTLNAEQQVAYEQLVRMMAHRFAQNGPPTEPHTLLLYGVTCSGKTEIYLQAIDYAIQQGKEAIVLVPEIALTPQTVRRFESRFGAQVSVLHSALSDKERYREWTQINDGKVKIAVGARSVLFAPFKNLGLIIVDEEHEGTYKQSESPRYHARDVAVMRGYKEQAIVILGSATPSFESYYNAMQGRYVLARLTQRAEANPLPEVQIVDMRVENADYGPALFSQRLVEAMRQRLYNREQIILFLNRRGYARQLHCDNCGYDATCSACSVAYTYHKSREMLMCHFCGETRPAPSVCPSCGDKHIRYSGSGTEKIEITLQKLFPSANIARMDSDTMTKAEDYVNTLQSFQNGKIDILLGTQMIAKGLHFPRVTLVGILNADLSLMMPDFRAEERTFQLLTQVAGRAGRSSLEGLVLIQTRAPFNPAITHALAHDYDGFWEDESSVRKDLDYPPYRRMIAVYFRGEDEALVQEASRTFHERILPVLDEGAECSPPLPAPIERIKGKFRYVMTFSGHVFHQVRPYIRYEVCHGKYPASVDIYADVDPVAIV